MTIRSMEKNDCEEVTNLFADCFMNPWSKDAVEEMFDVPGYYNLVAIEEKICGYIGIKAVLDEADIVNVAVDSSYRRKGIGKSLLQALLDEVKEEKIKTIYLEVRQGNTAAIALYKQAGFYPYGVRENYYSKPTEDALLMKWSDNNNSNSFQ